MQKKACEEVHYCLLCGKPTKVTAEKMICTGDRCKFRVFKMDDKSVTENLEQHSSKGKAKYCYSCGSLTTRKDGFVVCTLDSCNSIKLVAPPDGPKEEVQDKIKSTNSGESTSSHTDMEPPKKASVKMSTEEILDMKETAVASNRDAKTTNGSHQSSKAPESGYGGFRLLSRAWKAVKRTLTTNKSRPQFNIVLIGETGSGKTSFLNLLCNSQFVCELGFEDSIDQLKDFHDLDIENSQQNAMESKTSDAKGYNVKFEDLDVVVIDTPGFGDSRGFEEDQKNVRKIIERLESAEYVNCICLIINGRQSRATFQLRYVLTAIAAALPKTAFNNLFIIFTNCRDVTDANFDVKELRGFFGEEVELNLRNVVYLDNPYSKLEKCRKEQKTASKEHLAKALRDSFRLAAESLTEMVSVIKDFKEIHTNSFVALYNAKQEVEEKLLHLMVAEQNKTKLEKEIKKKKEEIEAAMSTESLNKDFTSSMEVKKVLTVPTPTHNTICGYPNCNSNCHVPCYLSKTIDRENLKSCHCISGSNDYKCNVCGHSYKDHYHTEYIFDTVVEVICNTDEVMKQKYSAAHSAAELATQMKLQLDEEFLKCLQAMQLLCDSFLATLNTFHRLGSSSSYQKLLEAELYVIQQRIKAQQSGDDLSMLHNTEGELNRRLAIVKSAKQKSNDEAQCRWALSYLNLNAEFSDEDIEKAYKNMRRATHPDKEGGSDEAFQQLQKARDILVHACKQKK